MATLAGKITDVTGRTPELISSITVKAPAARIGSGTDVIVSSPATVDFNRETGDITISNLTGGLSWLFIEGDGWADSIALAVADGMVTLVEAIANASGIPGISDYIALLSDLQNRIDNVAQGAVDSAAESIKWIKTPLTSSDNLDVLTNGLYPVRNGSTATALGLPEGTIGWVQHVDLDPSRLYRRQYYRADATNSLAVDYRRTYYNGTWNAWAPLNAPVEFPTPYLRGAIPEGVTPEQMTGEEYQGLWTYSSLQAGTWSVPSSAAGFLNVMVTRTSTLHEGTSLSTPIRNFQRRWYNGNWSGDWEIIGSGSTPEPTPEPVEANEYATATSKVTVNSLVPEYIDPTDTYEIDHTNLVDNLKSRLGTVSTGGKAAVALVADHGTTAFKEWLWQAAKDRGIPFTMALAPEIHLDGKGDARHTASNDEIKQWISEGLVIASHSGDHTGALGYFDISRQIKTSKAKLEEKLETTVDCWVQPGYTLATGNYDGFGTGQSASRYTDYYAGRMLQQTYAVVTGYAGDSFVYPGDDDLPVGVRRSLTERKDNQAGVIANIEQAISTGGKHINFCHPYALPDSSSTYVTKAEYIAYLDWLVQKRDAGDLVLLTLPQLAIAQP